MSDYTDAHGGINDLQLPQTVYVLGNSYELELPTSYMSESLLNKITAQFYTQLAKCYKHGYEQCKIDMRGNEKSKTTGE